jgi:hypothetical protein
MLDRASSDVVSLDDKEMGMSTSSVIPEALRGGDVLPFPPTRSASVAGRTLAESDYHRRVEPRRLRPDAPNILIVLIDDAGPGLPSTFGGEVTTATLDRIAGAGITYNRFHTTAMCSPTRASLLTGRNHHRVGNGQIAELANDWDGYSGHIPKSSATGAEVLRQYGYSTAAFGKWHNTPAEETTAAGPFDNWPTGVGFEHFYGFLAGEASQYEPNLVRNTTSVLPPRRPEEGYHLSEDLADDTIDWLRKHRALEADKPFFMYWASGCLHGPHHIMKEWADKYAGKFDDGWDAYRERVFERAKEKGWIPESCELTERHPTMASWDSIPDEEKPFRHPSGSDRRQQLRSDPRRSRRRWRKEDPVLRGDGESGHLPRRLDGVRVRPSRAVDARQARRHRRLDTRSRHMGALQPRRGLVAEPRPRRGDAREACGDERDLRDRSGPQ